TAGAVWPLPEGGLPGGAPPLHGRADARIGLPRGDAPAGAPEAGWASVDSEWPAWTGRWNREPRAGLVLPREPGRDGGSLMRTWLVTGGSGFLGRHVLTALSTAGSPATRVAALGRTQPRGVADD